MSKFYNSFNLLTDEIHSLFNNKDVEVYFKPYLLFYADDTVIFKETVQDLQKALVVMQRHFNNCYLKVNTPQKEIADI